VQADQTQQFTATVQNTTNTAVTWQVSGVTGGNTTIGTISSAGLYTAPDPVPNPASVTVTAVSQADTTQSASASVSLVYPTPTLSSITPATLAVGGPNSTVTLTGSNFVSTSQAAIGSSAITTTFVSPTQVTAVIPASDLSTAGTLQLVVTNPSPGGGTSPSLPVTAVSVAAFVILSAPSAAGSTGNSWDIAVAAQQPDGTPIQGLPVALTASVGTFNQAAGVTDSNGTFAATLTTPNATGSNQPDPISAVTGAQTAATVITLPTSSAAAAYGSAVASNTHQGATVGITAQSTTTSFYNFTFSEGAAGGPGAPNPFDGPNALCYQPSSLTGSTISTACQSAMTQDKVSVSTTTPLDQFCQTASDISSAISNFTGAAECAGAVGLPVVCGVAATLTGGVGALLCTGTVWGVEADLALHCLSFLAELYARDVLHNPMVADAISIGVDPSNPAGYIATFCTLQNEVTGTAPQMCPNTAPLTQPICPVGQACLFVTNSGSNTITAYEPNGTSITVPPGAFPGLNGPDGIAFDAADNDLYVTNTGSDQVTVYDLDGNQVCPGGQFALTNPLQSMGNPEDITYDPETNLLYINDPTNNNIYAFDENGFQHDLSGSGATIPFSQISQPWGIFYNETNTDLYVTNDGDNSVQLYDSLGNGPTPLTGSFLGLSSPDDLAVDPLTGNMYVTEAAASSGVCAFSGLQEFTGNGVNITPAGAFSTVYCPDSMLPIGSGASLHLYVTNIYSNQITVYDSNGNDITSQVSPGGFQSLNGPTGIAEVVAAPASGSTSLTKAGAAPDKARSPSVPAHAQIKSHSF
jgi:DNA-binding beta-propeller fold protein YncE